MAFLHEAPTFKLKAPFSPPLLTSFYFPAGSISSAMDSIVSENTCKSIYENAPSEEPQSFQMITYESICYSTNSCKETQTDENPSENLRELNVVIQDLKAECKSYIKQNQDLRNEIKATRIESESEKTCGLKEEIKRLKGKLHVHETMVEKLINIIEDLSGETLDLSRRGCKIDFHTYNHIISKLEIFRSRHKRQNSKIQQLENDKSALTELLNFYISAAKLIETQKSKHFSSGSLTPDCINPLLTSRKSSLLIENSSNTIQNTPFDEQNYSNKKPSSSGSENFENKEILTYPNTIVSLKGISKLTKPNPIAKRRNNVGSNSVSPLVPQPKRKISRLNASKENVKSTTIKMNKNLPDEASKRRKRCKS